MFDILHKYQFSILKEKKNNQLFNYLFNFLKSLEKISIIIS